MSSISVPAQHLARTSISIFGDGYIVDSMTRPGIGTFIEVYYISSTDNTLPSKTVTIIVVSTYNTVPDFEMYGYVPVGVVDKNGKIYGVFARFD